MTFKFHPGAGRNGTAGSIEGQGTIGQRDRKGSAVSSSASSGSAGDSLAQKDRARGLTPGSGTDGSAGSVEKQGAIGRRDRISDAAAKNLG
jgi:hypothetical protein